MMVASRRVQITNPDGLHMRPARSFVTLASQFRSEVFVVCDGNQANGKSLLDLMGLAMACGATPAILAHGPDAEEAVAKLSDLVSAADERSVVPESDELGGGSGTY